ncbi:hypothetical protein BV22DRAFT_1107486 [Leucogyrophana mollusca]|uniref:Uncharacterized protein n=1 Tax=Leucogyrophana mollusca TaxID=85980 RepID=A0ACB8B4Y2_9AGAM|nr:hypothetical protein BV22DRAFT_1107486 [Leucogyrophana mollusca]
MSTDATRQNTGSNSDVHPSAVGSNTQPTKPSSTANGSTTFGDDDLPPQRHAGAVGLGPEYAKGAGFVDKIGGLQEELKGKILRKPDIAQHGHERRTGELKKKEGEEDSDDQAHSPNEAPIPKPGDEDANPREKDEKAQAATIAPEGTEQAQKQSEGGNVEGVKTI